MQFLATGSIRERIIASSDQAAAADMMLEPPSGLSPREFIRGCQAVWEGRVAPLLLWDKHPWSLALAGLTILIFLAWIGRLFRPEPGPRPRSRGLAAACGELQSCPHQTRAACLRHA